MQSGTWAVAVCTAAMAVWGNQARNGPLLSVALATIAQPEHELMHKEVRLLQPRS